jgi:hypothetical protein
MTASPMPDSVTACLLDGNTLGMVALARDGPRVRVDRAEVIELPRLAEITERVRHPIFMDVHVIHYVDPEAIRSGFRELMRNPVFQRPVVGLFPAEKASETRLVGPATEAARRERRAVLLARVMAANPYYYPSAAAITEIPAGEGQSETRLYVTRLEDLIACAMQYEAIGQPFLGVVIGQAAASALARRAPASLCGDAVNFLDIGKLRTVYTLRRPNGEIVHYPIPVGLARDDMYYFASFEPTIDAVSALARLNGRILFPPEFTPSPLFRARKGSAQIDCTRFAVQVARFARRALTGNSSESRDDSEDAGLSTNFVLGRARRLPGLDLYLSSWTAMRFHNLGDVPLEGVTLAPGVTWEAVADAGGALGAGLAYFDCDASRYGLFLRDRRPKRLSHEKHLDVTTLEDSQVYVFEHAYERVL